MTTTDDKAMGRGEIDELLPWFATGRLAPADAARVATAVKADAEMARRLELARDEMYEAVRSNEAMGAPSPRAIETLFARIEAEPKRAFRAAAAGGGMTQRFSNWVASLTPRTLAYATAAGAVALMLQAGVIGSLLVDREAGGGFETASFNKFEPQEASYVMVAFADGATAGKVLEFLKAQNAMIVDGPRANGLFKLRVAQQKLDRAELDRIVQRMKAESALVKLVAPTQ